MKTIGIYTRNFSVFHDIVSLLKERDVEFFSLGSGQVPPWITVVLTTRDYRDEVRFGNVVLVREDNVEEAVEEAILLLHKDTRYNQLTIGIDPGEKPGVAVYGDGKLITTTQVEIPEDIAAFVTRIMDIYSADRAVARIGNGAPTFRNRIINTLLTLDLKIEMVDESRTTFQNKTPDIHAAMRIGMKKGRHITQEMKITPTDGELSNIKRRSRLLSKGRFTISRELAQAVATGEITLNEAVEK
ncbi:MAG: hypothetical protein KAU14_00360, partial [Thermoplasmata archaeon]|nr:hypothetical protein [Thermoplasmata archaeon]